ncbi:uncharacterized protein LOC132742188 [Ruditapes philippinarum]|uniref:uncharacterized protein LOC132742188 n=1 Tax=Ruditapes philippinarum TaxID=129788 RepID=UPI00295B9E4F|nr:uncharacterized protein LOC132742188 [Ruditapes philippinarum]
MIGEECPEGFRKDAIQESCLEYDSFGPIPNITEIGTSTKKILRIGTCEKIGNISKENKRVNEITYRMLETPFVVLKKNSRPCPKELNYLQEKNYCGIKPGLIELFWYINNVISQFCN